MSKIAIIGGGFSGLSAACFIAKHGHEVTLCEKNESLGGRARFFSEQGFMFDMGPSWYWMPDIFENFFAQFGKRSCDYYKLVQLDPGFQVISGKDDVLQIPSRLDDIYEVFENIEKGSATQLKKFLAEGSFKYKAGMQHLVYKPSFSWLEFAEKEVITGAVKLHMFQSVSAYVRKFFKDERLVMLMEFPVLFLGAMAQQIPALYSLMNYAALSLGTWYPIGGMAEIPKAMEDLAASYGVRFMTGCEISKINIGTKKAISISSKMGEFRTDGVIATGDYHHTEQHLLEEQYRNYDEAYWDKRTLAPSCLIFYIGVNKKIKKLIHHNLFFDASFENHAREIYKEPKWPDDPLFYACCPSKTDISVAPEGMENLFLLVPVATGLEDNDAMREKYFGIIMRRLEGFCGEDILNHIIFKRSYCIKDFAKDYHAYKGNAYGLANTLRQTAVLKPTLRNKKIKNLFYAGQLTVPGPGVPPALISGQLAADQLLNYLNTKQ
jgi:phytoene desaturase